MAAKKKGKSGNNSNNSSSTATAAPTSPATSTNNNNSNNKNKGSSSANTNNNNKNNAAQKAAVAKSAAAAATAAPASPEAKPSNPKTKNNNSNSKDGGFTARKLFLLSQMILCVVGIYVCFGMWSLLQERVITKPYHAGGKLQGIVKGERVPTIFGINLLQAIAGFAIANVLLLFERVWRQGGRLFGRRRRGDATPLPARGTPAAFKARDVWQIALMGFTNVFGSALGYAAMRRLSYPVVLATKMSKMVPVMLVGVLWYGTRYSRRKLLSCLLITAGVLSFYLLEEAAHPKEMSAQAPAGAAGGEASSVRHMLRRKSSARTSDAIGFLLLFINLVMDGFTNSTQDVLVRRRHWGGNTLMAWVNAVSGLWVLGIMLVMELLQPHYGSVMERVYTVLRGSPALAPLLRVLPALPTVTAHPFIVKDLSTFVRFLRKYPEALYDILKMSSLNALGQFFIFRTISLFGSLTLTTMTLLRKMGSVVLSIFVHKHRVNLLQWISLLVVGVGVVWEAHVNLDEASARREALQPGPRAKARLQRSGARNPAEMLESMKNKKVKAA